MPEQVERNTFAAAVACDGSAYRASSGKVEAVQPVEQVLPRRGQNPVLREMDMRIDETRHHGMSP